MGFCCPSYHKLHFDQNKHNEISKEILAPLTRYAGALPKGEPYQCAMLHSNLSPEHNEISKEILPRSARHPPFVGFDYEKVDLRPFLRSG